MRNCKIWKEIIGIEEIERIGKLKKEERRKIGKKIDRKERIELMKEKNERIRSIDIEGRNKM